MIDASAGQPKSCPDCGSTDVRWRGRRWYDVAVNWVRFTIEWPLAHIFRAKRAFGGPPGSPQAFEYVAQRRAYDAEVAMQVPRFSWSCDACGHSGSMFDLDLLEDRDHVIQREDALRAQGGAVTDPESPRGRDEPRRCTML